MQGFGIVPSVNESRTALVGDRLEIVLEATPGGGFAWQLDSELPADAPVELVRSHWEPASRDAIGAPSTQHFAFRAVARGSIELVFRYGRQWEAEARQRRRVTVTIT